MKSRIAAAIRLGTSPIAISFTDAKPDGAVQIKEGVQFACVIPLVKLAATKGRTAVFDAATTPCLGGKAGLCFGDQYDSFPGGFEPFLSTRSPLPPEAELAAMNPRQRMFVQGEGYKKTPELVRVFREELNILRLDTRYVVFEPLEKREGRAADLVSFLVNPDQLSALIVLANYARPGRENVIAPMGAGCQQMALLPYHESKREQPRAVIGCTDISVRRHLDADLVSFTVPWSMFDEMEAEVDGSFLTRHTWAEVLERIPEPKR